MSLKDKFVDYSYDRSDIKKFKVKDEDDLEYMNSVSSAMLMQNNLKTKLLLWIGMFAIIWLIAWAYNAKIDALTRGQGKIIPSNKIQVIQNREGGIVSEILVKEGDQVKKGDILVKIDDTNFASMFIESQLRYNELQAKTIRLLAESTGNAFSTTKKIRKTSPDLIKHEFSLYKTNLEQLNNNIMIYKRRLNQKRNELKEAQAKLIQLTKNYEIISREVALNKPLVKKRIITEVEYLQLPKQQSTIQGEMGAIALSIRRLVSSM